MKKANESAFPHREEKGFYMILLLCVAVTAIAAVLLFGVSTEQDTVPQASVYQDEESIRTTEPVEDIPVTDPEPDTTEHSEETTLPQEEQSSVPAAQPDVHTMQTMTFAAPTETGEISRAFTGDRLEYNASTQDWRTHNGTDYSGQVGDPIFAVADGMVTAAGKDPMHGEYVILSHSQDLISRYYGLSDVCVTEGDSVKGGEQLAVLSDSLPIEQADGVHLHLEIVKKDEFLDPAEVTKP